MIQTPFSGAVKRMLGKINAKAAAYPVAFSIVVTSAKAASADLMIQTCVERTKWEEVDWNRNRVFGAFGACYQGCFQYFVYSKLFERLLYAARIHRFHCTHARSNVFCTRLLKGRQPARSRTLQINHLFTRCPPAPTDQTW